MTTDRYLSQVDDYIDGLLTPEEASAFEAHRAHCAACQQALTAAQDLADLVGQLPEAIAPGRDLWGGIEARLAPPSRSRLPWARLALAAAVLIAATIGATTWFLQPAPPPLLASQGTDPVQPLPEAPDWEHQMEEATAALSAVLAERRDDLDPEAVRIVEENLAVIDAAIRECHQALGADPDNAHLNAALLASWRRKVDLLELAVHMPSTS